VAMEIKVSKETYNPLLKRKEIELEIQHEEQGTPQRFEIRKRMASKLGSKIENVFVVGLRTCTGMHRTACSLQVYDDPVAASSTIPEHVALRNLPPEERAKIKEAKSTKEEKPAKPSGKGETKAPEEETKPTAKVEAKPETEAAKPTKK